jgi:hypothetical protein
MSLNGNLGLSKPGGIFWKGFLTVRGKTKRDHIMLSNGKLFVDA